MEAIRAALEKAGIEFICAIAGDWAHGRLWISWKAQPYRPNTRTFTVTQLVVISLLIAR